MSKVKGVFVHQAHLDIVDEPREVGGWLGLVGGAVQVEEVTGLVLREAAPNKQC